MAIDIEMAKLERTALEVRDQRNEAMDLLRRIRKANIVFPSMCANNMEAMNLLEEIDALLDRFDRT